VIGNRAPPRSGAHARKPRLRRIMTTAQSEAPADVDDLDALEAQREPLSERRDQLEEERQRAVAARLMAEDSLAGNTGTVAALAKTQANESALDAAIARLDARIGPIDARIATLRAAKLAEQNEQARQDRVRALVSECATLHVILKSQRTEALRSFSETMAPFFATRRALIEKQRTFAELVQQISENNIHEFESTVNGLADNEGLDLSGIMVRIEHSGGDASLPGFLGRCFRGTYLEKTHVGGFDDVVDRIISLCTP
jgi:chromosome segregation ATPase